MTSFKYDKLIYLLIYDKISYTLKKCMCDLYLKDLMKSMIPYKYD